MTPKEAVERKERLQCEATKLLSRAVDSEYRAALNPLVDRLIERLRQLGLEARFGEWQDCADDPCWCPAVVEIVVPRSFTDIEQWHDYEDQHVYPLPEQVCEEFGIDYRQHAAIVCLIPVWPGGREMQGAAR